MSHYFLGNDPSKYHSNVPQFGRVLAKSVYRGVDVAYYGTEGKLEYDFVVAPWADQSRSIWRSRARNRSVWLRMAI